MIRKVAVSVLLLMLCAALSWSQHVARKDKGKKIVSDIVNTKDSSVLIEIPNGRFTMGSNEGAPDEKPVHTVYLDKFYIGKYEVTVAQFNKFCSSVGRTIFEQPKWNRGDNYPVVGVAWDDAKAYCDWAGLRLPTEAEWEKAARGTDGREYPWGNDWDSSKCNHSSSISTYNNVGDIYEHTALVGSFKSGVSPYGVYDMAGNVWEWCNDWYGEDFYASSPDSNPQGPSTGKSRVLHGGGWVGNTDRCRSAERLWRFPVLWYYSIGFRVAK